MKNITFIVMLLLVSFWVGNGCRKDEEEKYYPELNNSNIRTNESDSLIIDEFRTTIFSQAYHEKINLLGQEKWECTEIKKVGQYIILKIPFLDNENQGIKNMIYAVKNLHSNTWKFRLMNKKYYEFLYNHTNFITNKIYYESIIKDFADIENKIESGYEGQAESRCNDIIMTGPSGVVAIIDCRNGNILIVNDGGATGCSDGSTPVTTIYNGITIVWVDGGNPVNSTNGNNNGDTNGWGSENWNPNENNGIGGNSGNPLYFNCSNSFTSGNQEPADFNNYNIQQLNNLLETYKTALGQTAPIEILTKLDEFCMNGNLTDFENCANASIACYLQTKYKEFGICELNLSTAELFELYNFFENKDLFNPCTGSIINKGPVFENMCLKGQLNMAGLNEELEGMDYITSDDIVKHEELFQIIGITDFGEKLKLLSGNYCGEDFQVSLPKVNFATATCKEIFDQMLNAIFMVHYFNKCANLNQKTFNWEHYFTNMENSKSCSNITTTYKGWQIKGSFEINFTLSANPQSNKFVSNINFEHQGTTYGSGIEKESYIVRGPNTNAPLIHFGINSTHDQNFTKLFSYPCK